MSTSNVRLSPSSLQSWYETPCPKQWQYGRELEVTSAGMVRLEIDTTWLDRGTLVHSMMEGEIDPDDVTDSLALGLFSKLQNLLNDITLLTDKAEKYLRAKPAKGITWVTRIDNWAQRRKETVLIDYKTTVKGWKKFEFDWRIAPKAHAAQAPGYLLRSLGKNWPKTILFLVAGAYQTQGEILEYRYNPKDERNLISAMQLAAQSIRFGEANGFPKIRGQHCLDCPFRLACWNAKGWRRFYRKTKR